MLHTRLAFSKARLLVDGKCAHPLIGLLVSPATPTRALGQVPNASCATPTTPTTAAAALPSISLCARKATTNDLCL